MKLPRWQGDREKRGMRPALDLRERLRLALKVAAVFFSYVWFEAQPDSGAAAAAAFAVAVGALSVIELAHLPGSPPRERIFTSTKRQAVVLHVLTVLAAAGALVAAVPRLP